MPSLRELPFGETFDRLPPAEILEALVDRSGLWMIAEALAVVAETKAAHIRETWQDEKLARQWEQAGKVLDRATAQLVKVGLP